MTNYLLKEIRKFADFVVYQKICNFALITDVRKVEVGRPVAIEFLGF